MPLLTTERLFWYCGDHTAKLEPAPGGRFRITKICCFLWHVGCRARVHTSAPVLPPARLGAAGLQSAVAALEPKRGADGALFLPSALRARCSWL